MIENALRKLDVIPRQVLVELMLAEVRLEDKYSFGVGWFFSGKDNVAGRLGLEVLGPSLLAAAVALFAVHEAIVRTAATGSARRGVAAPAGA